MTYARQRQDIDTYRTPTESGTYIILDDWVECWQPEALNDAEFNTVLAIPERLETALYKVASIDLEFKKG